MGQSNGKLEYYGILAVSEQDIAASVEGGDEIDLTRARAVQHAQKKEDFVRSLASEFSEKLKIASLNPKGKSFEQILEAMRDYFPTGKRRFSAQADHQEKMCNIMASIINKQSGREIFKIGSKDPKAIDKLCDDIAEFIHSLVSQNLHQEYVGVKTELATILGNLDRLDEVMGKFHTAIQDIAGKVSEPHSKISVNNIQQAYLDVKAEHDRQMGILRNLLDIKNIDVEVDRILATTGDLKRIVQDKHSKPGDAEFRDKIENAFGLYRNAAVMAKLVSDALKTVDMTLKEYRAFTSIDKLSQHISQMLAKKLKDQGLSDVEINKFMGASSILSAGLDKKEEIIRNIEGSAEVSGGLKVDKRVDANKKLRLGLIRTFNRAVTSAFENFSTSGSKLADKLMVHADPDNELLLAFIRAMDVMPSMQDRRIYVALTGYKPTVASVQDREIFTSHANNLIGILKKIEADKDLGKIEEFRDMRLSLESIIETVDAFSKKFAKGIDVGPDYDKIVGSDETSIGQTIRDGVQTAASAVGEFARDLPEHARAAAGAVRDVAQSISATRDAVGAVRGSDEDNVDPAILAVEGGALDTDELTGELIDVPEINKVVNMYDRTKTAIKYKFRISQLQSNMRNAVKELPNYKSEYGKVLGLAVADLINNANEKAAALAQFANDPKKLTDASLISKMGDQSDKFDYLRLEYLKFEAAASGGAQAAVTAFTEFKEYFKSHVTLMQQQQVNKVQLYKVAEAVDLYIQSFSSNILEHPESLQGIIQILDNTEIASKWMSVKSSHAICKVFESFPAGLLLENKYNDNAGSYALAVAAGGARAPPASNPFAYPVSGIKNSLDRMDEYKKHYYAFIVAKLGLADRTGGVYDQERLLSDITGDPNTAAMIANISNISDLVVPPSAPNSLYKTTTSAVDLVDDISGPGNPFVSISVKEKEKTGILLDTDASIETGVLKNIISTFVTIGDKFGDTSLSKTAAMSPIEIFKQLKNHLLYSNFVLGAKIKDVTSHTPEAVTNSALNPIANKTTRDNDVHFTPYYAGFKDLKEGATGSLLTPEESVRSILGIKMRGVDIRDDDVYDGTAFADKLYVHIIKAMVSKVFTAIGMYNTLNRPLDKNGLGYYAPLRMAIGADESVKIMPEAVELYVRLPLLAEWYREVIGPDTIQAALQISMLPDADGVFSGLIDLIFDKLKYIENGAYSETDTRNLVIEVNKIYSKYGDCRLALLDFVNEINRRIGVLDQATYSKYKSIKQKLSTGTTNSSNDMDVNFKLSTIDESDGRVGALPSDSYVSLSSVSAASTSAFYKYTDTANLLNSLYGKIDSNFKIATGSIEDLETKYSFTKLIDSKRTELSKAADPEEQFRIIQETIAALGQFSSPYLQKAYIMFHETVMYPLQTLGYIREMLQPFYISIDTLGKFAKLLEKLDKKSTDPAVVRFEPGMDLATLQHFCVGFPGAIPANLGGVPLPAGVSRYGVAGYVDLAAAHAAGYNNITDDLFEKNNVQYLHSRLFNLARLLPYIFEQIYQLNANDLITVNVTSSDTDLLVSASFSKLRDTVSGLLGDIKRNLEKFRGVISPDIIEYFEKLSSQNPNSLYALEDTFFNEKLDGKYGSEKTLDAVANNINLLLRIYTNPNRVDDNFAPIAVANFNTMGYLNRLINAMTSVGAAPDYSNTVLGKVLTNRSGGSMNTLVLPGAVAIGAAPGIAPGAPTATNTPLLNVTGVYRPYLLVDTGFSSTNAVNKSIRVEVNQLLYAYLATVYDDSVNKVYKSSIEQIVNSNINYEFTDPTKSLNSAVVGPLTNQQSALYDILAAAYREAYTQMSKTGDKHVYLTSDLLSLPTYYRDKLACRLPYFKLHAESLLRRIELARNIMRPLASVAAAGFMDKQQQNSLMDNLNSVLIGLINSVNDTLAELNDQPVYLEVNKSSINEYKSITGGIPFMPNSSLIRLVSRRIVTSQLANSTDLPNYIEVPMHSVGTAEFKFTYGVRGLLGKKKYSLDEFTGFVKIMEDYNMRTKGEAQFTKVDLDQMIDRVTQLNMYGFYKRLREFNRRLNVTGIVDPEANTFVLPNNNMDVNLYQLTTTAKAVVTPSLTDVLRLTEDTNQRSQLDKMANFVAAHGTNPVALPNMRKTLRTYNIVDANIVPINVHALQRELPFVNIFNASWIYDHYMKELHELDENPSDDEIYRRTDDPKKFSYELIVDPYAEVSVRNYYMGFHKMMVGNMGIEGLGRPRYLAEEIYNKPLFGELYANRDTTSAEESANRGDYDRNYDALIADFMSRILPLVLEHFGSSAGINSRITAPVPAERLQDTVRALVTKQTNSNSILPPTNGAARTDRETYLDLAIIVLAYQAAKNFYNQMTKGSDNLFEEGEIFNIFRSATTLASPGPYVLHFPYEIDTPFWSIDSFGFADSLVARLPPAGTNAVVNSAQYVNIKTALKESYTAKAYNPANYPFGVTQLHTITTTSETISYPYYDKGDKKSKLQVLKLRSPEVKNMLLDIGFKRFNTRLIRNIIWLCNNQRFLRLKLRRELTWYDGKIVSDHSVTASSITEQFGNDLNVQIEPTYRDQYTSYKY